MFENSFLDILVIFMKRKRKGWVQTWADIKVALPQLPSCHAACSLPKESLPSIISRPRRPIGSRFLPRPGYGFLILMSFSWAIPSLLAIIGILEFPEMIYIKSFWLEILTNTWTLVHVVTKTLQHISGMGPDKNYCTFFGKGFLSQAKSEISNNSIKRENKKTLVSTAGILLILAIDLYQTSGCKLLRASTILRLLIIVLKTLYGTIWNTAKDFYAFSLKFIGFKWLTTDGTLTFGISRKSRPSKNMHVG